MCDRTIFVSFLPKETSKVDLQIYFQSKKKSGGGDVEEIGFDSNTGIAKIVFADSEVAQRVKSREHYLNGCKLTVRLANEDKEDKEDKEDMATSSVLVSGIADNTTDDALYNYFENTRRSSGGDVKEIKRRGNGEAVVTFESPDTAKRVLEWAKHVLDNNLLTLKRPEPPKAATSLTTEEPSMTEEKSRTIRVTGISPKTTKDALLNFFENKRRSGGGDVEDIQYNEDEGFAEITFCSSEDAENVSKQENLTLDENKLGLTLKELPIILPKDPCKLHIRGLSDKTTKDGFQSYIEVVSGEEVQIMLFGNDSNVMVTFEEPPDVEKVQTKCSKRPLDGNHLQVEQVSICNCVEVSGLGLKTTHDTILYYFENSKNGGGDVKKVEYTDGETKALVFFEEPSVVDRVVTRRHVINKDVVKVVPYYPFLGEASEEPGGGKKQKNLSVDPQKMAFIQRFFHKEFSDLLKEHKVKVFTDQDQVVLDSSNNQMDKTKWDHSCDAIETYISHIMSKEVRVSPSAWGETIEQAKQKFTSDKIEIVYKEDEQRIVLRGKNEDVSELFVQVDDLSKEIEKKIEYENAKTKDKISLTKAQLDLLSFTAETENLQVQYKDLEVKIDQNEGAIHFRGPDLVVKEGNISILKFLSKTKDQEMKLARSIVSIIVSDPGKVFLSKQFKYKNIEAVISRSDGNDDTCLVVTAVDRQDLQKAIALIKDIVIEDNVSLDPDQISVISSHEWKQLESTFNTSSMLLKVTVDTASNSIYISGIKDEVISVKERVLTFLEENTIIDKIVEADPACTEYVLRFQNDEVKKISDDLHVQVYSSKELEEGFTIRGTKQGIESATNKVLKLVNQVKDKSIEIEKSCMKKFFRDEKGKKLLSNIENDEACIIKQCSPRDDEKTNAAFYVTADGGSQAKELCSYITPERKNIIILKGDMTELKVDVMVNAANGQLQHVGGLAKAIVDKGGREIQDECNKFISRNNDLLDGEVFVSGPGKLPCERLVHAVGPKWNTRSKTGGDRKTREERVLAQAVFNALDEAKDFTSIAIPAISSGVFAFPIDLCAKTILESVLTFSKENASVQLSKFYIIDTKDDVTKAFHKEMKLRFGKEKSFTDGVATPKVVSTVISSAINTTRGKRRSIANDDKPRSQASPVSINDVSTPGIKIEVIVGDLAKDEAHVIVNTVATDLNLSKNPCAKALSNAAGPNLQQECNAKGQLSAGELLVTKGYSLGCKNVFHVVLGNWDSGKGEKVLRAMIVSCLKEAGQRNFSSIAFPAIGTGNLGFPRDVVARVFFQEINKFKKDNPQSSVLEVHLVLFYLDQPTIDAFHTEEKKWSNTNPTRAKRKGQPFQVLKDESEDALMREVNDDSKNTFVGSVRVDVVPGDITKESTEAIATASNQALDVAIGGGVGAAIAKAGGPSIQDECRRHGRQAPGSVVCTSAGNLPSKKLFHLVAASFSPDDTTDVVLTCLKQAESQRIRSIAIPAVGTGNANISPKEAAKALLKAVGKFCKTKPSSLQHIRIVVFQERMLEDFHRAIDELEKKESVSGSSWGFWSWLKSWIVGGGGSKSNTPGSSHFEDVGFEAGSEGVFSLYGPMFLKIFASSTSKLRKAESSINDVIKEQCKRKVVDKPQSAIEGLSKAQEERILKLQDKHLTEIKIEKHSVRIVIEGLSDDVHDATFAIYDILNEKTAEEHERKYAELVSTTVQWYYTEKDKREAYDDITNAKIEEAFKNNKPSVMIQLLDVNDKPQDYSIIFATMEEKNLSNGDKCGVHREELGKSTPLPQHWDPQPVDAKGKEKDLHLVQLDQTKNEQEYDKVYKKITQTSPINIVKIERVQNPELYRVYMVKKQKMDDKDGSNEMSLFHGTAVETCIVINHKGFNRSYCGKNAVVYGKGVYFARDASYSMRTQYSPADTNGNRCMYLANVLVGQYTVGNQNMIAPPPKSSNNSTITYDTTVDNVNNPQVFVAYHDNQVYPEYLITFK